MYKLRDHSSVISPPATRPEVASEVFASINPQTLEDSYVYVHCHFNNTYKDMLIRIWKTTYLIDRQSGTRSALIHAENISFAPQWTLIPDNRIYTFLLVFSALPSSCRVFDLIEEISQPGGFFVQGIQRNETDIYHIDI